MDTKEHIGHAVAFKLKNFRFSHATTENILPDVLSRTNLTVLFEAGPGSIIHS